MTIPFTPDPILGSMRDYADEMDEIVEDIMRRRQLQAWLPAKDDFAALEALSEATGRPLTSLLDESLKRFLKQEIGQSVSGA